MTVIPGIYKLCRLMRPELPETILPIRLVKTGKELSGSYDLHQFDRVIASLDESQKIASSTFQVSFRLEFSRDAKYQIDSIVGNVETVLPQVCQRCMQPMQHKISGLIKLAIVPDEDGADNLPEGFEAYIDTGSPVALKDFIEDELLLALPYVALHEEQECPTTNEFKQQQEAKENPFAELKNLKLNS